MRRRRIGPYERYSAAAVALTAATAAPGIYAGLPVGLALLAALNLTAAGLVVWDKRIAGSGALRVPERLLFVVAALGGSPGVGLSLLAVRHKTRKPSFLRVYWTVVALQVLALTAWVWRR